jgi:phage baseplate assembly protein W
MSFDLALVNNDLRIKSDGTIQTVTDTPKLRQDIIKIVITPLGSMKHHMWYGCAINDEVIGNVLEDSRQLMLIKDTITKSLERLKALQKTQSVSQNVSLAELIEVIGNVNAERDINDMRQLNIVVTVFSKNLAKIEELFTIISVA